MNQKRLFRSILIMCFLLGIAGIALSRSKVNKTEQKDAAKTQKTLVTFVELGSVKCIPCRQMKPVMAAVEKKYGDQIKVVFYDVWKSEQRVYAEKFGIRVIPTQVFLDKDSKEFFRHEGFFPEAEIDKLLQKHGLKIRSRG